MRSHFILFILMTFLSTAVFAGTVVKTSGKKVYILFDPSEGGTFQKNDLFNITNQQGKKLGVVELTKVQGYKALGVLKKGKAQKGNSTLFRSVGKKSKMKKLDGTDQKTAKEFDSDDKDISSPNSNRLRWGLQLGYGSAEQDVEQDAGISNQTGTSFAAKGIMDYPLLKSLSLHGALGAEIFSVSGTGQNAETLQNNVSISSDITFLSIDTLLKWAVISGRSSKFYLLGGIGILHPLSKSSDSIDSETISSLALGQFGAGVEFPVGGLTIPLDITYYLFPKSDTVSTSIISVKLGVYF